MYRAVIEWTGNSEFTEVAKMLERDGYIVISLEKVEGD